MSHVLVRQEVQAFGALARYAEIYQASAIGAVPVRILRVREF